MGHQQRALIIQFCKKNRTKRKTERERGREKAHKKNAKTLSSSVVWEGGRGTGGWMVHIMFYVHMESSLEKPGENENELCFSSLSFSFFFFFLSSFYLVLLLFYSSFFFVFPFTYRELFRRFAFAQVRVNNCPYMLDAGGLPPSLFLFLLLPLSRCLSAKQPPVAHLMCMCSQVHKHFSIYSAGQQSFHISICLYGTSTGKVFRWLFAGICGHTAACLTLVRQQ